MPKNNRSGQATVLNDAEYLTIKNHFVNPKHKLIVDVAWWTGERMGAVCKLPVKAVFDVKGQPLTHITFPKVIRKASPNGERKTRQVPVHKNLRALLREYWQLHKPDINNCLFPGSEENVPIQLQSFDDALRRAISKAGMESQGISTHSFRRSFITKLARKGIAVSKIQKLTGHADLKVLSRYIEVSDDELAEAIAVL
ncbi:integrase family protein [Calothrix sp. PCC 7716]|nr:integrase family protein [Calothrix sp. PCC 7716]